VEGTILREVQLDPLRHRSTGKTRHFVGGAPWEGTRGLRIVRFESEAGFYLLYLDESGREVTDTWHQSLSDAMKQANFEFSVEPDDWTIVSDPA
jgi:hypothetical protein